MKSYWLAPFVVAMRMPILADEAQRMARGKRAAPGRSESERMVTEKLAAASEGLVQTALEATRLNIEIGLSALRGDAAGIARLVEASPRRLTTAALAPSDKRLRRNAKRLAPR